MVHSVKYIYNVVKQISGTFYLAELKLFVKQLTLLCPLLPAHFVFCIYKWNGTDLSFCDWLILPSIYIVLKVLQKKFQTSAH